jgi:MFS superfamily sulfate permease-like transporter
LVGLGIANLAAGFVQGFPISSSASRTPVAEAAGARTQLTGVVGALAIAVLLVAAPNLLQHLPSTALAARGHRRGHRPRRSPICAASIVSSNGSSGSR